MGLDGSYRADSGTDKCRLCKDHVETPAMAVFGCVCTRDANRRFEEQAKGCMTSGTWQQWEQRTENSKWRVVNRWASGDGWKGTNQQLGQLLYHLMTLVHECYRLRDYSSTENRDE